MELKDLVGKHWLTAADMDENSIKAFGDKYAPANCMNFVLDGKTYTAVEDPDDGYRSSMLEIFESDFDVANKFQATEVLASMQSGDSDILEIRDTATGKIVLTVGTDYSDDYYPSFVRDWIPENLKVNQGVS